MYRPGPVAAVVAGASLIGAGAGLLYLIFKKKDLLSITNKNSKRRCSELLIPKESVGVLIGRGGSNIKDIQDKTGTKITFKDEIPGEAFRICLVHGVAEKVKLAETMILDFIASQPKLETMEIYVPQRACGRIIGRGGNTIRSLCKASGAKINVESGDEDNESADRRITLRGTSEQTKLAKSLIEDLVDEDGEVRRSVEYNPRTPRSPSRQLCISSNTENYNDRRSERQSVERLLATSQGGFLEVYVSAVKSPGQFWIQKVGPPGVELDKLVETMTEFYGLEVNRDVFKPKEIVKKGDMIAAQFAIDGKWYRAQVHEIKIDDYDPDESKVLAYFVDYGDSELVSLNEICRLKVEFLQLRQQAIECSLAGVAPSNGSEEWSEAAIDLFEDLSFAARWVPLMAKVQRYRDREQPDMDDSTSSTSPIPLLDLIVSKGTEDLNISNELVRQGFAVPYQNNAVPNGAAQNGAAQNGTAPTSSSSKGSKPGATYKTNTQKRKMIVGLPAGEEDWEIESD